MDLERLRCFVAVAEELHFGRAAQALGMLPASLGRHIRLLEEDVGTPLFARTTRRVALTEAGRELLDDVRKLLAQADTVAARMRNQGRHRATILRIGAIDSAAAGFLPRLLQDIRAERPDAAIEIDEDRSIRLLPRLLSGRLDLAFLRPPDQRPPALEFEHLVFETAVVALPVTHALARGDELALPELADVPLIVPDRRSRPHSHDLTMRLFAEAGLSPRIGQIANEKQTIINLVGNGLGAAIVPRWAARMAATGVVFLPIRLPAGAAMHRLPLSAAYLRHVRDPLRDVVLGMVRSRAGQYFAAA